MRTAGGSYPQKPKRGRPPKPSDEGQRIALSIRLKPAVAAKVRAAAEQNSRSLSDEMEFRISQSFEPQEPAPLQIILDTSGMPTSWEEVHVLLEGIIATGKVSPHSLQVMVRTPEFVSSYDRRQETEAAANRLYSEAFMQPKRRRKKTEEAEPERLATESQDEAQTGRRGPESWKRHSLDHLEALEGEMARLLGRSVEAARSDDPYISDEVVGDDAAKLEELLGRQVSSTERYRDLKPEIRSAHARIVREGQKQWREKLAERRKA